jgi:hypothetical protein
MKWFYAILVFAMVSCSNIKPNEAVHVEYKDSNIIVNFNRNKGHIEVPYAPTEMQATDITPAFCIDSTSNSIFIYVPSFGIKKYNLSNNELSKEAYLEYIYRKMNHSYSLSIINEYVVLSSYLQVLVYNKNLEIKADLRDTIETNLCPKYALHYFNTEFSGDTILFKAMFVEINDFDANKRYKRIYKDYEFILEPDKIICNNCDSCRNKKALTKSEMDELSKNPY